MKKVLFVALMGATLAGCAAGPFDRGPAVNRQTHNALVGGALGTAAGCGIGSFWGACGPGAAIGAVGGALVGSAIPR